MLQGVLRANRYAPMHHHHEILFDMGGTVSAAGTLPDISEHFNCAEKAELSGGMLEQAGGFRSKGLRIADADVHLKLVHK